MRSGHSDPSNRAKVRVTLLTSLSSPDLPFSSLSVFQLGEGRTTVLAIFDLPLISEMAAS